MISPHPTAPPLPPQPPLPTGAPPRRGLRLAIVVIVLLAIIVAVVSTAPSTLSHALNAGYPKPMLGAITISGGSGSNIPLNQSVQFSVQVQAGRDLSYQWDFGDNSGSTASNPTHSYSQFAANLTVSVTVTDPIGQQATASSPQLTVLPPPPTASFLVMPQGCNTFSGCSVSVDASGSQPGAQGVQITTYAWNWGDGQSDQQNNPSDSHSYSQPGNYTIMLTVTDQFNQTGSSQQSISLVQATAAFVIVSHSCDATANTCTVNVDASGSTGQGALTYNWDWGDGNTNSTTTPQTSHSYTYQTGISYTITLTVTDSSGQTSQSVQMTVNF